MEGYIIDPCGVNGRIVGRISAGRNPAAPCNVYEAMAGWILFSLVVTLVVLRAFDMPEARLVRGAAVMGIGIWLIWVAAVPTRAAYHHMPDTLLLLVGVWFVVRGALRFASY